MGLYLWELEHTNQEDEDIFAILDDQHSKTTSIGIEPKNLKKKLEEYGLQKGNSHVHRVLGRLVQARLVSQEGTGFYLTDLGRFVAEQIHNIRQFEVIE
jgi:predicted transcriptional regulator